MSLSVIQIVKQKYNNGMATIEQLMLVILMRQKYFPITLEKAFERDLRRGGKSVGRELLIHQYKLWLQITKQKIYLPNNNFPKALICDVDGTIAEINGRSYYDYNKVSTDIPREEIYH